MTAGFVVQLLVLAVVSVAFAELVAWKIGDPE